MEYMFNNAQKFNQPIGSWDVSRVTNMQYMFYHADVFNQPIGSWDVSSVTNMHYMFEYAPMFAQSLESWPETSVTTSTGSSHNMFHGATAFHSRFSCPNGNHGPPVKCTCKPGSCLDDTDFKDGWSVFERVCRGWKMCFLVLSQQVSHHGRLGYVWLLICHLRLSNRSYSADFSNISRWDTSGVKTMRMFNAATTFNQEIGSWNVSQVTDMSSMFEDAENFNSSRLGYVHSSSMGMFAGSISFSQPVLLWNTSNLENTTNMFLEATAFMSLHACSEGGPLKFNCAECLTDFI